MNRLDVVLILIGTIIILIIETAGINITTATGTLTPSGHGTIFQRRMVLLHQARTMAKSLFELEGYGREDVAQKLGDRFVILQIKI